MDEFESFPGRPDHPDFWKLSDIVLRNDGRMDEAKTDEERDRLFKELVNEFADAQTVFYLGLQRSFRILGIRTAKDLIGKQDEAAALAALYVDAFVVGAEHQKRTQSE